MQQKKNIGLFFGSFNPIHVGHLILAQHICDEFSLSEIWFVVSPQNPLKKKSGLLAAHHRLALVREAIGDNQKFKACDIEFNLSKPSYTIHTLLHLSEEYPNHEFCLLLGQDNLHTLPKWKNYQEILGRHKILVYPRRMQESIPEEFLKHPQISISNAPVIEISSSQIRQRIQENKPFRYLLTESVHNYVSEMHFYEAKPSKEKNS